MPHALPSPQPRHLSPISPSPPRTDILHTPHTPYPYPPARRPHEAQLRQRPAQPLCRAMHCGRCPQHCHRHTAGPVGSNAREHDAPVAAPAAAALSIAAAASQPALCLEHAPVGRFGDRARVVAQLGECA
eukprot:357408-Chlamydomonas_euryale.AAC.2